MSVSRAEEEHSIDNFVQSSLLRRPAQIALRPYPREKPGSGRRRGATRPSPRRSRADEESEEEQAKSYAAKKRPPMWGDSNDVEDFFENAPDVIDDDEEQSSRGGDKIVNTALDFLMQKHEGFEAMTQRLQQLGLSEEASRAQVARRLSAPSSPPPMGMLSSYPRRNTPSGDANSQDEDLFDYKDDFSFQGMIEQRPMTTGPSKSRGRCVMTRKQPPTPRSRTPTPVKMELRTVLKEVQDQRAAAALPVMDQLFYEPSEKGPADLWGKRPHTTQATTRTKKKLFGDDVTAVICPSCKWEHGNRCTFCLLTKSSDCARLSLGDLGSRLLKKQPQMKAAELLEQLDKYGRSTAHARQMHYTLGLSDVASASSANTAFCAMHLSENSELEVAAESMALELKRCKVKMTSDASRLETQSASVTEAKDRTRDLDSRLVSVMSLLAQVQSAKERWRETAQMAAEDRLVIVQRYRDSQANVKLLTAEVATHESHKAALHETLANVETCLYETSVQRTTERMALEKQARAFHDIMARRSGSNNKKKSRWGSVGGLLAKKAISGSDCRSSMSSCDDDEEGVDATTQTMSVEETELQVPSTWEAERRQNRRQNKSSACFDYKKLGVMTHVTVLDEVHTLLEKKTLSDGRDDSLGKQHEKMPRFLELYMHRKFGLEKIAKAKIKSFQASLYKWLQPGEKLQFSQRRRMGLFATALGLVEADLWTPAASDVVLALYAACDLASSLSESLKNQKGPLTVTRKDVVTAVECNSHILNALLAVSTPKQHEKLVEALYAIPADGDVAIVVEKEEEAELPLARLGQDRVDAETCVSLVLDHFLGRLRATLDKIRLCFEGLCATKKPITYKAFLHAARAAGLAAFGDTTLEEAGLTEQASSASLASSPNKQSSKRPKSVTKLQKVSSSSVTTSSTASSTKDPAELERRLLATWELLRDEEADDDEQLDVRSSPTTITELHDAATTEEEEGAPPAEEAAPEEEQPVEQPADDPADVAPSLTSVGGAASQASLLSQQSSVNSNGSNSSPKKKSNSNSSRVFKLKGKAVARALHGGHHHHHDETDVDKLYRTTAVAIARACHALMLYPAAPSDVDTLTAVLKKRANPEESFDTPISPNNSPNKLRRRSSAKASKSPESSRNVPASSRALKTRPGSKGGKNRESTQSTLDRSSFESMAEALTEASGGK